MSEPAIPIAYGFVPPMAPAPEERPPLATATGRSSRVLLPHQEEKSNNGSSSSNGHSTLLNSVTLSTLTEQGYTRGLAQALAVNKRAFALAIWVIDNSGSMQTQDGHRIVEPSSNHHHHHHHHKRDLKFVECTRWAEMQQTVDYHAQMASLLQAPTVFRMLNDPGRIVGPQQFSIAVDSHNSYNNNTNNIDHELAVAQQVMMNSQPSGVTPLTLHLREIRANLLQMEAELRRHGTKVAIILATDGLPTDLQGYSNAAVQQEFVQALRALEGLPVWVVVRLCTDEAKIVEYWNDLDAQLELSLEVLDDFLSEAQEVHDCNKWLNYGLPLHRMREMGFHHRIFDLLDERQLTPDELRDFCKILFGPGPMDEASDPQGDWKEFCQTITRLLAAEAKQWNPVTKRMEPWIDMKRLNKEYGHRGVLGWLGL